MTEIYLKRKIDTFLLNWKEDANRLPLIVRGPRQVGKTESIRRFAERVYKNSVYINFVEYWSVKFIDFPNCLNKDTCLVSEFDFGSIVVLTAIQFNSLI